MSRFLIGLSAVITVAIAAAPSAAAQLIFEPATGTFGDFGSLPAGYGDRIAAASQDGFLYSLDGGATPNVVTQFGPSDGLVSLYTWSEDYGDLHHIIFAQEPEPFEFRLVADPGFKVTLNSFDMAGWSHLDFPSIASVSVEDGIGNVFYSQSNVHIDGDATEPQHTHFSFAGVSAPEIRVKFDSRTDGHVNVLDSDDVGLDNINFSQSNTGPLAGDYNHNGTVDAADYTVWRDTLGQMGTGLAADGDHDGTVNSPDYGVWATNFGATPGSAAATFNGASVPEPPTTLLIIALIATAFLPRCGRSAG